jgi:hypothetical protein
VSVLAVICLKSNQALVVLNFENLPATSCTCIFAHLDEDLVLVIEDHLGNCELSVLSVEDYDNLRDVGVVRQEVRLAELVSAFAFCRGAVGQSHAEAVDIVLEPLKLGDFELVDFECRE